MANEISVTGSVQVAKGNLQFQSRPSGFKATMAGRVGATPGGMLVPLAGADIDLSALSYPGGWCVITNTDPAGTASYLEYGVYDPVDLPRKFLPIGELLPGEAAQLRLSRQIGYRQTTGTGTAGVNVGLVLRLKAVSLPVAAKVEAFDA